MEKIDNTVAATVAAKAMVAPAKIQSRRRRVRRRCMEAD